MPITITTIETTPEFDHCHQHGTTTTRLSINPQEKTCWVSQWRDDYANADYALGKHLYYDLEGDETPDEDALRAYLTAPAGQDLLAQICAAKDEPEEVEELLQQLAEEIAQLPSTEWTLWSAKEFMDGHEYDFVTATTTDAELPAIVKRLEQDLEPGHRLQDSLLDHLRKYRDRQRAKAVNA